MMNLIDLFVVGDTFGLCEQNGVLMSFKILGIILNVLKIVVPILLIVLGSVDFFKAVLVGKDEAIKKSAKSLGRRFVAAVVVFLIPTLVGTLLGMLVDTSETEKEFKACIDCVFNPLNKTLCDPDAIVDLYE